MNRRSFCLGLLSLQAAASASRSGALRAATLEPADAIWNQSGELRFVLQDLLEHPFYWWPRTLLTYPIQFHSRVDLDRLTLTRVDTGEQVPIQFSGIVHGPAGVEAATLNFFSDLPSGARREFALSAGRGRPAHQPGVKEARDGSTIVLDSGLMRVRIPATQMVHGDAPGPILQVSRGEHWMGSSTLTVANDSVVRITSKRVADGPLFIAYEIAYETLAGSRYVATVQCEAGLDFVRFRENMEGMRAGAHGVITSTWSGFGVTHRQAPNHPYPISGKIHKYEDYPWERVGESWPPGAGPLVDGALPFNLGIFQTWNAFRTVTFANFWDEHSDDALGVFIDDTDGWQDHQYTNHVEAPDLQVRYFYRDAQLSWQWPIVRGSRSTCVACYDHDKDRQEMKRVEKCALGVKQDGVEYRTDLIFSSYVCLLQSRHNTLDLNSIKDWVLDYPDHARRPPVIFTTGAVANANDLEKRVMAGPYVCTLPVNGTRQDGGASPIPGKGVVAFAPVPARQVQGWWIDGFNRCSVGMTDRQRKRLTAMYLFMAYVHAGDDYMPLVPMLSGHPNFLADVKGVPPAMSFLFPDHPLASTWADLWQKCVEINTRYNTRPDVTLWNAHGGRWTENLGTYVWAFLRPSLRSDFLLRQYDGVERFVTPQLAEMADWLVNALSAPFEGETPEAYEALQTLAHGHEWGALAAGHGMRRVYPPQGAHSERRVPPRSLWYLGTCLSRFAPLAAEHAMWAARPTNQDMETALGAHDSWDAMYRVADNRGTNPHLTSRKYTGYGIVMRAAVDTPAEVSIHLQQIDEGPNYRWGRAAEGGCGVIYYFAAGKSYSFNGTEDVGDRDDQDTDFCTNFGVYKNGEFRSIGQNVLSRPFYDLGCGQFAELVPRQEPGAYSAPEYVSRSILAAGTEYFLLYDNVLGPSVTHRFSWFVRLGSPLPNIQFVRGASKSSQQTQRTPIETVETTGFWMDGSGDSMAVVSHLKEIAVEAQPYGCRVHLPGNDDLVFRSAEPVEYSEDGMVFSGTAGLIRTAKDRTEFALFHGTKIGAQGFTLTTEDTELGIGGVLTPNASPQGKYFAPAGSSSIRVTITDALQHATFYIDGEAQQGRRDGTAMTLELKPGTHSWELTDGLPVPIAPRILRTENHAGGARVILSPVAGAEKYRVEVSRDSGATWTAAATVNATAATLDGFSNGTKIHVRATAVNAQRESVPGPEYPLYVTSEAPPPPDGLCVDLADGAATLTWGEVLGVGEYRLYTRSAPDKPFRLLYSGLERTYVDKQPSIRKPLAKPEYPPFDGREKFIEYCVSCVNANGESVHSRVADTNPASWRNWDPMPGEGFRRPFDDMSASASIRVATQWPRYYPK